MSISSVQQPQRSKPVDPQFQACSSWLPATLRTFCALRGSPTIISLGPPRILFPVRELLGSSPVLHVYENNPLQPFNNQVFDTTDQYVRRITEECEEHGFHDVHVHCRDLAAVNRLLDLSENPVCLLLDTCNLHTIASFIRTLHAGRGRRLHWTSLLMLNTDERRVPGTAWRWIPTLFRTHVHSTPCTPYVAQTQYEARGTHRTRTLTFCSMLPYTGLSPYRSAAKASNSHATPTTTTIIQRL